MQSPRAAVIAAMMRKDFLLVWPLILAALISPAWSLTMTTQWFERLSPPLQLLPVGLGALLAGILALNTFHQDTPASLTHDWLTRPIGPATMVASKIIFLLLVLFLPTWVGHMIEHVIKHHSPGEVVLSSLASTMAPVGWVLALALLGLVTVSVKQASTWGYGVAAAAIAFTIARVLMPTIGGAGWLLTPLFMLGGGALAATVLWLVFQRRRPLAARVVYVAGSAVLFAVMLFVPPGPTLALQRALSPDAAAAAPVKLTSPGLCIAPGATVVTGMMDPMLLVADGGVAARPADSTVLIERTRARYILQDGRPADRVRPWNPLQREWATRWTAERATYEQMARDRATLRFDYDLALLEPAGPTTQIPIGRGRRYVPQLGYCSARNKLGVNVVECFKPFAHSAAVRVEVVGRPDATCVGCEMADYTPAIFHGAGARRNVAIALPGDAPRKSRIDLTGGAVRLTPMKVKAHFRRNVSTPLAPLAQVPVCSSEPGKITASMSRGAVSVEVRAY